MASIFNIAVIAALLTVSNVSARPLQRNERQTQQLSIDNRLHFGLEVLEKTAVSLSVHVPTVIIWY